MSEHAVGARDLTARIESLWIYPAKGCGGFALASATVAATGLEVDGIGDREWLVVDQHGRFRSQRELPKMALIKTRLTGDSMRFSAPEMPELEVPFASGGDLINVQVWNDGVSAVTQGLIADAWLTQFLGVPCRLARFDPEARRLSNRSYTGSIVAPYKFADAFSLLVCARKSLADLNARLASKGQASVSVERFRPNVVLEGIDAFEEDYVEYFEVAGARLRVAKPCVRCTVPNVDLATGEAGVEPGNTLASFRRDERAGGITFGVNAIVESGAGTVLTVGDSVEVNLRF